jgi:hypothetical protein
MKLYQYQDEKWLTRRYCIDQLSMRKIAQECEVCGSTIVYWLRKLRIYTRSRNEAARLRTDLMKGGITVEFANATYRSMKWLQEKRTKEKLTVVQIAKMCHVRHTTICAWLKKRNFKPGGIKTGPEVVGTNFTISKYLRGKVDEFCRSKRIKRSALIRELLIEKMLKEGFNPYR